LAALSKAGPGAFILKTILLDVDGTLIDSNDAHARAWVDALEEAGFEPHYVSIRKRIGMGGDHLLPNVTGVDIEEAEGKAISRRRGEIFREKYLPNLKAFPQTRELLLRLKEEGHPLVIATSASKKDLQALLEQAGLGDLDIPATTADDADASKPEPDIIFAALEKAGVKAADAIMLGDTPYDVAAAKKAGVATIGFTCGGWMKDDLDPAIAVYEGPMDLLMNLEESPLSKGNQRRAS
jgi:HAD superfamily hydrolase (TIGR01509 family)